MAHEYVYWNQDQSCKGAGNVQAADHVCRPVIVDSQGRKRPIVCFTPVSNSTETRVTTIETVIESFHPPAGAANGPGQHKFNYPVSVEYKHTSPGKVVVDEHRYSYPYRLEYKHSSDPEKADEYKKHSHAVRMEEYRHSSQAETWGRRPSSPGSDHDRPESLTKLIQTEISRAPVRPGPLTALTWRQPRNSSSIAAGGDYWKKPNGDHVVIRSEGYEDDDYCYRRQTGDDMPTSGKHVPVSTGPKYTETIDSREAAKRYGSSFSGSPTCRPYSTAGGMVIDSKTAEEKYKGANVR